MGISGARHDVPEPLALHDVFLIAKSRTTTGNWTPTGYTSNQSRSCIEYMLAIVVVGYDPTGLSSTHFSPPVVGDVPTLRSIRSLQVPFSRLDMTKLSTAVTIDGTFLTAISSDTTEVDDLVTSLEATFDAFGGDIFSGWSTDTATPGYQHPGYGTTLAACVSQALVLLSSDYLSSVEKEPLARKMTQWGLDLWSAFLDGRVNQANGGHCQGRKALVLFAGYMLDVEQMLWIDDWFRLLPAVSSYQHGPFNEDGRYFFTTWEADAAWTAGWRKDSGPFSNSSQDGSLLDDPVATWGSASVFPGTWAGQMKNYMGPTIGADIGTALFMNLHGIERAWSEAGMRMVRQWMGSVPTDITSAFTTAGVSFSGPALGEDYGTDPYVAGLCAQAWTDAEAAYDSAYD